MGGGLCPTLGVLKNHQFVAVGLDHTTSHLPLGEPLLRVQRARHSRTTVCSNQELCKTPKASIQI